MLVKNQYTPAVLTMIKSCPECDFALIKKHDPTWKYSEMAFSKMCVCSECDNNYRFCIICRIIVGCEAWFPHHLEAHRMDTIINRNRHFTIIYEGGMMICDYGNTLQHLYESNTQLASLTLLRRASYSGSCITKMHNEDVYKLIYDNVFNNDYKCFFCDCYYDSFPTKKMVRVHFKTCAKHCLT